MTLSGLEHPFFCFLLKMKMHAFLLVDSESKLKKSNIFNTLDSGFFFFFLAMIKFAPILDTYRFGDWLMCSLILIF